MAEEHGPTREFNFDGLVGPTHTYGGLGPGNLASQSHRDRASSPRAAVLQGLDKMALLHGLGVPQAVLPPTPRPDLAMLRRLGFSGADEDVIQEAAAEAPRWLAAAYSASSMWAANAATVASSVDTQDSRLHLTPANLISASHRASESRFTAKALRAIFSDPNHFTVHDALPAHAELADEGAANHTRLGPVDRPGVHLFVYGDTGSPSHPERFRPRQQHAASEAIARLHRIAPARCVFAQQHPAAIDAGVFHHDVIGVGHENLKLIHEYAWVDQPRRIVELRDACERAGFNLQIAEVPASSISLDDAVSSYLFNSQVVTLPDGRRVLIAPQQCETQPGVRLVIDGWVDQGLLAGAYFVPLDQSMANGGGPACLRLRVLLTPQERAALPAGICYDEPLDARLRTWANQYFRERLTLGQLGDPDLIHEARAAHAALCDILRLSPLDATPSGLVL